MWTSPRRLLLQKLFEIFPTCLQRRRCEWAADAVQYTEGSGLYARSQRSTVFHSANPREKTLCLVYLADLHAELHLSINVYWPDVYSQRVWHPLYERETDDADCVESTVKQNTHSNTHGIISHLLLIHVHQVSNPCTHVHPSVKCWWTDQRSWSFGGQMYSFLSLEMEHEQSLVLAGIYF